MEKLQIFQGVNFSEDIAKEQYHVYYPRTSNFNLNDEIRISIQNQDIYTLPAESFIYIEGKFKEDATGTGSCRLTNNAYAFLFEQIRYEMNGVEIDRCMKPGITSTMKAYASLNENESKMLEMAGWCPFKKADDQLPTYSDNRFNACIPLKFLVGWADDYKGIILGQTHELILIRSKTDDNCYQNTLKDGTKKASFEIEKIEWYVPHISVNEKTRLKLLQAVRENKPIYMPFRKWQLFELPSLRNTKNDIWPVKTSTNLEKPRYVIVGFQRKRKDNSNADSSVFDHSSLTNIKLYLNSESYPYTSLDLNMKQKRYTRAYHMYSNFRSSYYERFLNEPLLDYSKFHDNTLFIIDCSKQNESLKSTSVDIKLEMECDESFEEGTVVYALILHDNIIQYQPLSGTVQKII